MHMVSPTGRQIERIVERTWSAQLVEFDDAMQAMTFGHDDAFDTTTYIPRGMEVFIDDDGDEWAGRVLRPVTDGKEVSEMGALPDGIITLCRELLMVYDCLGHIDDVLAYMPSFLRNDITTGALAHLVVGPLEDRATIIDAALDMLAGVTWNK